MNWFSGSIPEAVGLAKSTNAIFVVYIHDGSEASKTTDEALGHERMASLLSSKKFVALKLENGTEGAKQFSQIYPLVLLPSLYFISGSTGIPLEILGGAVTEEKLKEAINKFSEVDEGATNNVVQMNSEASPEEMIVDDGPQDTTGEPSESTSPAATQMSVEPSQSTSSVAAQMSVEPSQSTSSAAAQMNVEPSQSTASVPSTITATAPEEPEEVAEKGEQNVSEPMEEENGTLTLEERVERAKILLAEKQSKKNEEKAEEERRKEVERRKMGQEIAKRKRQMNEEEVHSAVRERKKEKEEDRAARERVKAQIAADRREREARAALLQGQGPAGPSHEASAPAAVPVAASNSTITRIKFRLPDGSSNIAQFPVEATLSEVREHVAQQFVSSSSFTLMSTMHPQPFTTVDSEKSLKDLGLVPSAILVVVTSSNTSGSGRQVSTGNGIMEFLWLLLSPITFILGFVRQLFSFGSSSSPSSNDSTQSATTQQRPFSRPGNNAENRVRHEGNIYRLRNSNDDEDNNTWNGNSTQQM